ncbi:MAG: hypothetical protein D6719_14015 [Candidatus Dadabacteria bacterium]|nr:MAG: hypothetical protein D6719_14015 [Candidatus Dadabacteria bacterium]
MWQSVNTSNLKRTFFTAGKAAVTLLVIFYVYLSVKDSFAHFDPSQLSFSATDLFISLVIFLLYHLNSALIWQFLTVKNGVAINTRKALPIWFKSVMGKYVPGKALMWVIRLVSYREENKELPAIGLLRCFILEYLGGIASAVIILLCSISFFPSSFYPKNIQSAAALVLIICCLGMHPYVLKRIGAVLSRSFGITKDSVALKTREVLQAVALSGCNWFVLGLSMFFAARAFYPELNWSAYLYVTSGYIFAGVIGFLAIFAPSGIGVREGLFIAVLAKLMPLEIATIVAIAARLVSTAGELIAAFFATFYSRLHSLREFRELAEKG